MRVNTTCTSVLQGHSIGKLRTIVLDTVRYFGLFIAQSHTQPFQFLDHKVYRKQRAAENLRSGWVHSQLGTLQVPQMNSRLRISALCTSQLVRSKMYSVLLLQWSHGTHGGQRLRYKVAIMATRGPTAHQPISHRRCAILSIWQFFHTKGNICC